MQISRTRPHLRTLSAWWLLAVWLLATSPDASSPTVADRLDALIAFERESGAMPPRLRREAIERRFTAYFSGSYAKDTLAHMDDNDLKDLFRAAQLHAFHSPDPRALDDLRAAYLELTARGAKVRFHALSLHRAFLWHRRFEDAAALDAEADLEMPSFEARRLPPEDNSLQSIWMVDKDGLGIDQHSLGIDELPHIVMITQPHCGFSQRAMAAIARNPDAAALFGRDALILIPPKINFDIAAVHRWNTAQPKLPMVFANRENEWPEFTHWETPVFYFLRDGKVTDRVVGWPNDERIGDLLRIARKRGLLTLGRATHQNIGEEFPAPKNARTSSTDRVRANGGNESRKVRP
ncbi:MAG: hypothetical protein HOP03_12545 [Lysobacter sp.]|nr:hypothetical protein [Lysobacter sp.]